MFALRDIFMHQNNPFGISIIIIQSESHGFHPNGGIRIRWVNIMHIKIRIGKVNNFTLFNPIEEISKSLL